MCGRKSGSGESTSVAAEMSEVQGGTRNVMVEDVYVCNSFAVREM